VTALEDTQSVCREEEGCYGPAMNSKFLIMVGLTVGSAVGSFIPALWGADWFSMWSVFLGLVGGLVGIWAGYRLSRL
jgi:hypothetical protein